MERARSISKYQLFAIMFICTLFGAIMYSENTIKRLDLLLYSAAAIIAAGITVLAVLPLILFRNKTRDCNIIKAVQISKPVLSGVYAALYMVYFIYFSIVALVLFSLMLSNFINQGLSFLAFFILTLGACYYAAYKGINGIGRAAAIFAVVIAFASAASCFSISFRVNALNYSYVYLMNTDGLFENIIHAIVINPILPSLFLISDRIKGGVKKPLLACILTSYAAIFLLSTLSFGVLGEYFNHTTYPFYYVTQLIEAGAFQRLDAIFISLWTVGLFVVISISIFSLRQTIQSTFCAEKAKYITPWSVVLIGAAAIASIKIDAVQKIVLNLNILFVVEIVTVVVLPLTAILLLSKRKINSKAAKAIALTLVVGISLPLFTGCQRVQIEDRMFIKGVGIDLEDTEYAVTVQYVDNYADGDKQENKCLKVYGKSIGEAIGELKNSSGIEPFMGQNVAVIVGWETAEKNMKPILDYFVRDRDTRPTVHLYVSETTAEDILTLEVAGVLLPIDQLSNISPSESENDNYFTILNFVNQTKNATDTPTVSVLKVDENTIQLTTVAVFDDDKGLYSLDKDGFNTYKFLLGIGKKTIVTFDGITAAVAEDSSEVVARETDGRLDFDVACNQEIAVIENPDNASDSEIVELFDRELNRIVNECVNKEIKENQCDIYSLGRHLDYKSFRKYQDKELYESSLAESSVRVNVRCKIVESTGQF